VSGLLPEGPRGLDALTGGPQRRWDAMGMAEAPLLAGDAVHFVALEDGSIVTEEDVADGAVDPLADAIESQLAAPYRAEGIRDGARWAVTAHAIEVATFAESIPGDAAELVKRGGDRSATVDDEPFAAGLPALEAYADARADEYVARAERIDDDLWEVQISPL
jgi:hypothetical protein